MKKLTSRRFAAGLLAGATAAAIAAVLGVLTACGTTPTKTDAPEPSPSNILDGTNTQVIRLPDGFRNIAFTCYGSNGVYVTSRGVFEIGSENAIPLASGVFVVPGDVHCPAAPAR
ncbi:hypothetical protein [Dactylosporangium sp. CS-033363]|uniref:hypothetical protein n=1 Tax=Dactylosporangium sp. CS-033363 TaxID=3239935 RepID=UPI003D90533E